MCGEISMSKIEQIFQSMIEKIEKMPVAELDEKLEKNRQTSGPTVAQFLQDYVVSSMKHTNEVKVDEPLAYTEHYQLTTAYGLSIEFSVSDCLDNAA